MTYLQFVITLALALDAFWAGIATSSPPPNKSAVKEWQAAVEAGYAEIARARLEYWANQKPAQIEMVMK